MSEPALTVELAHDQDGKFIGWRLSVPSDCLLVWADQSIMEGFRIAGDRGRGFTPRFGGSISYTAVDVPNG